MSSGDDRAMSADDLAARLAEALAERDEARAERDEARRERDEARNRLEARRRITGVQRPIRRRVALVSRDNVSRRVVPVDTRPIITWDWINANPDEFERLYDSRPAECPVCFVSRPREYMDAAFCADDMNVRCTHWACLDCWQQIARRDRRCPFCRDDLSAWLRGLRFYSEI